MNDLERRTLQLTKDLRDMGVLEEKQSLRTSFFEYSSNIRYIKLYPEIRSSTSKRYEIERHIKEEFTEYKVEYYFVPFCDPPKDDMWLLK